MSVSVLIPAFNESNRIVDTIRGMENIKEIDEIIVVNDGSTDDTADKAKKAGAKLVNIKNNSGKGKALKEGLKYVKNDVVAFIDADVGLTSREVIKLIEPVINGEADVTVARFPKVNVKSGFGFVKKLAKYGVKLLTGYDFDSTLSGQRVFKKEVLDKIKKFYSGYGIEVGMTIDILNMGYKIKEIDVDMTHSVTLRDLKGFIHRGRQFIDILKVLFIKAFFKDR
ncbi:glycosyltransferase family 2 protein [Thermoanaerobacterium thermosaccharolyticum]|jgi:glycosyltransferase involved in cell wall biosynthesis|nr:glycosyltransferase family 2 protein [Thermoanaerobacterium thermosaccharolyticum]KAA5807648.1 glycosyltransferase family 2 protein [Thermoanaerobacterium thermosaccharolyticum]MCP2239293.1 glycosyltransferase involved in cell wall biosynthesis [Thermoanaerobacterium thermosaccharolyticum]PHO06539.1 glycosyl transferase [Thermoanaerobacterium thermosaccharolyticum]TCW37242.1 glycosyl transferase family 2 [Thermohydrogenium kirishiense]